jgi:hypothetical protein
MDNQNLEEPKNVFQQVLDLPFVGDVIGLIVALAPPFFLTKFMFPIESNEEESQKIISNLIMSSTMFFWNFILFFIFRIKITLPIIPIPLFVIGLIGMIYQIIRYLLV